MPDTEFGRLLSDLRAGDRRALDELFDLVYRQLKAEAHHQVRNQAPGHTLNTTVLVHEAYIKLAGARQVDVEDRRHFMRLAARAMRQILVGHARERLAQKRGGAAIRVDLDAVQLAVEEPPETLVALEGALTALEQVDERLKDVFELRFFGGYTVAQTAELLQVGATTVKRDWLKARIYVSHALAEVAAE